LTGFKTDSISKANTSTIMEFQRKRRQAQS